MDEDRPSFAPAVWQRPRDVRTDLRQVWFLGAHSNVGGGLPDQELANVSMAWMMDQLASIGVVFEDETVDTIFQKNVCYYFKHPQKSDPSSNISRRKQWTEWAIPSVYDEHRPVRPWALGRIYQPDMGFYRLAGKAARTPGMYRRIDPETGVPTSRFLANTNERIHQSVRVRLALEGLGYDDMGLYKCPALLKEGPWQLERLRLTSSRDVEDTNGNMDEIQYEDQAYRWGWVYVGPKGDAPPKTIMMEETLGPYERKLFSLNKGELEFLWQSVSTIIPLFSLDFEGSRTQEALFWFI